MTATPKPKWWISRFAYGDVSIYGGPKVEPSILARVTAEQVNSILQLTPIMMVANIVNAVILDFALFGSPAFGLAVAWSMCVSALCGYALWSYQKRRTRRRPLTASSRALSRTVIHSALLGGLWALVPPLFCNHADAAGQLIISWLVLGMMCGGAFALAPVPAASIIFTLLIATGTAVGMYTSDDTRSLLAIILLIGYTYVITRASAKHAILLVEHLIEEYEGERQRDLIGLLLNDFEENASDWLWEIDTQLRFVKVSPRMIEVTGLSESKLLGSFCLDIFTPGSEKYERESRAAQADLHVCFRNETAFRDIVVPVGADGRTQWWSLTAKPNYDVNGVLTGFRGVGADITKSREAESKIAHMALYDSLTGLANRVRFTEEMSRAVARAERLDEGFAVMCIDLDQFKMINDTLGHPAGDMLLTQVADRLRQCVRDTDTVARLGGDEFAIIQANVDSPEEAALLAERVQDLFAVPFRIDNNDVSCGCSIGIALSPADGTQPDGLLKNADLALYRTKANGRGHYCFFESGMDQVARERHALQSDLHNAISRDEFSLDFQPVVSLADNSISVCEALIRWHHPVRGAVSPSVFIPLAEDSGLIHSIGEWAVREACHQAMRWPDDIRVAVNLSVTQFRNPGVVMQIIKALDDSGLPAHRLEVEITESIFIAESETATGILSALRRLGVRIALDDFGTGYSSLAYLRKMPFDKIKIDKSFVSDLMTHKDSAAIVHALISLAGELGMHVTAEGVETEEQMAHLRTRKCDEAQGYLISKPISASALLEFIANRSKEVAQQAA